MNNTNTTNKTNNTNATNTTAEQSVKNNCEKDNIYKKLNHIQTHLSVGKTQRNNFVGYNYRTIEDIMDAVKPLLVVTKTTLTFAEEIVPVGNKILLKETATLTACTTGESVSTTSFVEIGTPKKALSIEQEFGAAITYVRRYAASGLLCISSSEPDFDSMDPNGNTANASNANNRNNMNSRNNARNTNNRNNTNMNNGWRY